MSTIKISQLPAKGANLEATDLVEISEFNGSGYVSKSITGQEIIDGASGGGVTDVTATAPISSSGGSTPDISIPQASTIDDGYLSTGDWNAFNNKQDALVSGVSIKTLNGASLLGSGGLSVQPTLVSGTNIKTINFSTLLTSGNMNLVAGLSGTSPINTSILTGGIGSISIDQATTSSNGYLSSTDWNTFNGKQAPLVSGTNIKTINGSSVLGSGDLTISGGGGGGIHVLVPPISGSGITLPLNNANYNSSSTMSANTITTFPFIPANTFTIDQFTFEVAAFVASSTATISIYSNSNMKPTNRLYLSTAISTATNGVKTISASFTFTAGTIYWIGFNSSSATTSFRVSSQNWMYNFRMQNTTGGTFGQNCWDSATVVPGGEPNPLTFHVANARNFPLIVFRTV